MSTYIHNIGTSSGGAVVSSNLQFRLWKPSTNPLQENPSNFINGLDTYSDIVMRIDQTAVHVTSNIRNETLTASRVVVSDASKRLISSDVTSNELSYLSGMRSNAQAQIDTKQTVITGAATTIVSSDLDNNFALVSSAVGKIATSSITTTELNSLASVTGSVQTQLNNRLQLSGGTLTGSLVVNANITANNITATNLTVTGDTVTLNTISSNTEQMIITNAGTGPALRVVQTGVSTSNSVAEFVDAEDGLAMIIANGGNVGVGITNPSSKLHVSSDISVGVPATVLYYPPSGMTATSTLINGITYTASASSGSSYLVFAKNFSSTGNDWLSAARYNTSTGAYTPGVSTVVSGNTVYGDYVQLSMSSPITINQITHYSGGQTTSSSARHPKSFTVAGSTDGSTWTTLVTATNVIFPGLIQPVTYNFTSTNVSHVRFIIESTQGGSSFANYAEMGELVLQYQNPNEALQTCIIRTGNIGVGTATPVSSMHIEGGPVYIQKSGSNTYFNANASLLINEAASVNPQIVFGQQNTGTAGVALHGANGMVYNTVSGNHVFRTSATSTANMATSGTERMRITGSGNVGIGTSTPTATAHIVNETGGDALRVQGDIQITGNVYPTSCNTYDLGSSNFRWRDLYLSGTTINLGGMQLQKSAETGGLQVVSETNQPVDTTTRNLFATGNVGIGTTNPQYHLHIHRPDTFTGLRFTNGFDDTKGFNLGLNSTGCFLSSTSDHPITLRANGSEHIRLSGSGNLGIGTTIPDSKLHVIGDITHTGDMKAIESGFTHTWLRKQSGGSYQFGLAIALGANGLTIVGAGESASNMLANEISPGGPTDEYLVLSADMAGSSPAIRMVTSVNAGYATRNEAMTILGNGNVGIGTTNPAYKLQVEGSIYASSDIFAFSDSNFKENIKIIPDALDKVSALSGYTYTWKDDPQHKVCAGLLAQEVEQVLPEVVNNDGAGKKSIAYGNLVSLLIQAMNEQSKIISSLNERVTALESQK